jgi:hypothetical protein
MKHIYVYLGIMIFIVAGVALTGCYKDIISPETDPDGPPQSVSFKTDLEPYFNTHCALSGCHGAGFHNPNLTEGNSYFSLVNGGYVNTIVPKASRIYVMITSEMSEFIPSAKDKSKVLDWIRNGAPNN